MTSSECTLRYREAIHELVDGTLGPLRRAELQQHLDLCDDCRALADDLLKIRRATESLDPLAPPDRVWLQVAGRLRQEGRVIAPPAAAVRRNRVALLALAAALTIAVGSSLVLLWPGAREATSPQQAASNVPAADSVESISQELQLAEQHYQNVIVRLEQLAKSGDESIDPQTAATLQKTLQVIDQAIAESRAALRNEPQSAPARDSLFDALRRKVTLLQDTIALMNEMRKGNAAGAAQIVEGTNKS
jgi:anti-sigma factor RsiW